MFTSNVIVIKQIKKLELKFSVSLYIFFHIRIIYIGNLIIQIVWEWTKTLNSEYSNYKNR